MNIYILREMQILRSLFLTGVLLDSSYKFCEENNHFVSPRCFHLYIFVIMKYNLQIRFLTLGSCQT